MRTRILGILVRREWLDTRRQKRLWRSILLQPLMFVPLFVVMPLVLARQTAENLVESPPRVAIRQDASVIGDALKADGMIVIPTADPERAVLNQKVDVGVVIAGTGSRGTPRTARLMLLGSRSRSLVAYVRVAAVVERMGASRTQSSRREWSQVAVDLSKTKRGGRHFLAALLPLYLWFPFSLIAALAAGLFTGEKDARTFESLLVLPVGRGEIVAGKAVVAGAMAFGVIGITLAPFPLAMLFGIPGFGGRVDLPWTALALLVFAATGFAACAVGVGGFLGAVARSARESGTLLGVVSLPAAALAMTLVFVDWGWSVPVAMIPIVGPLMAAREAIIHSGSVWRVVFTTFVAFSWGLGFLIGAGRKLGDPRVILRVSA